MTTSLDLNQDLLYPESDGKPMAESTEQYRWIVIIKENLEILFVNNTDVFIAADLLWYPVPVQTPPAPSQTPDVMVVDQSTSGDSVCLATEDRISVVSSRSKALFEFHRTGSACRTGKPAGRTGRTGKVERDPPVVESGFKFGADCRSFRAYRRRS